MPIKPASEETLKNIISF